MAAAAAADVCVCGGGEGCLGGGGALEEELDGGGEQLQLHPRVRLREALHKLLQQLLLYICVCVYVYINRKPPSSSSYNINIADTHPFSSLLRGRPLQLAPSTHHPALFLPFPSTSVFPPTTTFSTPIRHPL